MGNKDSSMKNTASEPSVNEELTMGNNESASEPSVNEELTMGNSASGPSVRREIMLPKVCIFSAFPHGSIILDKDGNVPLCNVDPRIKDFYWVKSVVAGIRNVAKEEHGDSHDIFLDKLKKTTGNPEERCRLLNRSDANKANNRIRRLVNSYGGFDHLQSVVDFDAALEVVKAAMNENCDETLPYFHTDIARLEQKKQDSQYNDEFARGIHPEGKRKLTGVRITKFMLNDKKDLEQARDYVNTFDEAKGKRSDTSCITASNGRQIVNKTFSLAGSDIASGNGEDWGIACLNYPFAKSPNIFNLVYNSLRQTRQVREITMQEFLDWIANHGVEKAIFGDFSCAVVFQPKPPSYEVDDIVKTLRSNTGKWHPGKIIAVNPDNTYYIQYNDGQIRNNVPRDEIQYNKEYLDYKEVTGPELDEKKSEMTRYRFGGRRKRRNNTKIRRNNTKRRRNKTKKNKK